MTTLKIPTPLRPYAEGEKEIEVTAATAGLVMEELTALYPALRKHLFTEEGELRSYVNLFINDEDIRHLQGVDTPVGETDRLMIIPSIAGGALMSDTMKVDHAAIKVSQGTVIGLNLLAFILDLPWLALLVAIFLLGGSLLKQPGFGFVYQWVLRPLGLIKPELLEDHPEPHRFAQMIGGLVMSAGVLLLFFGAVWLGWWLVWLVLALAALNLFGGFCVGCAMYYWFNRLNVPGFKKSAPAGSAFPGARPKAGQL
ncbi:MAG: DUF4395 family protein [Anaerolineales bacterium]|nr:DUF4395 family protein [Anaerolineales bacterium]